MKTPIIALSLAVALGGCVSFGAKPPPSLMTLTPTQSLAAGTTQTAPGAPTITIAVPSTPQEIATLRVPVRSSATSVAYLKDALWVEPVNRQFARLLSDTIGAKTGRVVVGDRAFGTDPGASLTGELRQFGVDATTGAVVVTYDAALIRGTGQPFEKRRFEARVPTAPIEAGPVALALNQAANQVAGEVADWVGR